MIAITGAAGFIGSVTAWKLNQLGREDLLLVDDIDHPQKQKNIDFLKYEKLVGIDDFKQQLISGDMPNQLEAIIHLGAISSTTEQDWNKFIDRNIEYSQAVIAWCVKHAARCIYASSAATYGNGENGFSDDHELFDNLKPLNLYGQSKLHIDIWAKGNKYLDKVVGLRYFNVFGPNEYHKEFMRSIVAKKFDELQKGEITLFKSNHPDYADGEFLRDFVYVMDAVDATLFFLRSKEANGVFNIGTGNARTWNDLATAMFAAVNKEPNIRYIDMPPEVKNQYQYYTQADISKLKAAGYTKPFTSLEDAAKDYIQNYLLYGKHVGE